MPLHSLNYPAFIPEPDELIGLAEMAGCHLKANSRDESDVLAGADNLANGSSSQRAILPKIDKLIRKFYEGGLHSKTTVLMGS